MKNEAFPLENASEARLSDWNPNDRMPAFALSGNKTDRFSSMYVFRGFQNLKEPIQYENNDHRFPGFTSLVE